MCARPLRMVGVVLCVMRQGLFRRTRGGTTAEDDGNAAFKSVGGLC